MTDKYEKRVLNKKELAFLKAVAKLCKKHSCRLLNGQLEFYDKDTLDTESLLAFETIHQAGVDFRRLAKHTVPDELITVDGWYRK